MSLGELGGEREFLRVTVQSGRQTRPLILTETVYIVDWLNGCWRTKRDTGMYLKEIASVPKEPRGKGRILRTQVLKLGEGALPEELEPEVRCLAGPGTSEAGGGSSQSWTLRWTCQPVGLSSGTQVMRLVLGLREANWVTGNHSHCSV